LKKEQKELRERIRKLATKLLKENGKILMRDEELMSIQLNMMIAYMNILETRIMIKDDEK
jgi:hypothetical protein